ncbi:hypothetical protein TB2_043812 [Malus domestica]
MHLIARAKMRTDLTDVKKTTRIENTIRPHRIWMLENVWPKKEMAMVRTMTQEGERVGEEEASVVANA